MQAAETTVRLTAHTHGTCNAIAFWFNLHLDEETELHTSPYTDKVLLLCLLLDSSFILSIIHMQAQMHAHLSPLFQ